MKKEKVLITGAAGMLGTHLCLELIKQGYEVRAFCQNEKQASSFSVPVNEVVFGDVLKQEAVNMAIEGCSYVIHAAAMLSVWPGRSELLREVNINGTQNVMQASKRNGIKRMIQIGSASSFGMGGQTEPVNEADNYEGWKFGLDYLDSKYEAQVMLQNEYKASGFPVIIINPTFMIGPFDSGPTSGRMIVSICKGSVPGVSAGGKNFVYTGDVAVAAVNALTRGKVGECYIAGNENMTYSGFFKLVSTVSGAKKKLVKFPDSLVLMTGAASNVWSAISGNEPQLSLAMSRIALLDQYASCAKAVKDLDMPQTPLEVAVKKSIDWYREKNYL